MKQQRLIMMIINALMISSTLGELGALLDEIFNTKHTGIVYGKPEDFGCYQNAKSKVECNNGQCLRHMHNGDRSEEGELLMCVCNEGFHALTDQHGWHCDRQSVVDCVACDSERQCSNHGTCKDTIRKGEAYCNCDAGYFGGNCSKYCPPDKGQVVIKETDEHLCRKKVFTTCECKSGWRGEFCSQPGCPSDDEAGECHGQGVCEDDADGNPICKCEYGWTGDDCSVRCPHDCNHGTCKDDDGTGVCDCEDGWSGDNCSDLSEREVPSGGGCPMISGEECGRHSSCKSNSYGGKSCECDLGWSGEDCTTPKCPDTYGVPCTFNGECIEVPGQDLIGGVCECEDGYSGPACSIRS